MDSNVTKNTFLYKFLKLDVANNNLGLKQVLQQQLLQAIYFYHQQHQISDSWDSIIVSLPKKLILRNRNNHKILTNKKVKLSFNSDFLVYHCAIAFPLANFCRIKPLEMAEELVSLFSNTRSEEFTESHIKIVVKVISPGWIDFQINCSCLGIWLEQLILKLASEHNDRIETHFRDKNLHSIRKSPNLFAMNYYHARCCSLLKLAEQEQLIKLDNHNFQSLAWQIRNPHPIIWFDDTEVFLLTHPQELNLLHSILLILDRLGDLSAREIWINYGLDLTRSFEQFMITCRFSGKIQHENTPLAIARLGLIALVQWCLSKILKEKLQIQPISLREL